MRPRPHSTPCVFDLSGSIVGPGVAGPGRVREPTRDSLVGTVVHRVPWDDELPWAELTHWLVLKLSWAPHDLVEDAVQDALVTLLEREARGGSVHSPRAFALRVAQRRLVDRWRASRWVSLSESLEVTPVPEPGGPVVSWNSHLIARGLSLTPNQVALLAAIDSGARSTKAIARALNRTPKTVRERRLRLLQALAVLAPPPPPPPPPLTD
ncbi:MAG: RNA polymerase sigma factor [Planctomycetota bacterium]